MHRSQRLRSAHESAGPLEPRAASAAAARLRAARTMASFVVIAMDNQRATIVARDMLPRLLRDHGRGRLHTFEDELLHPAAGIDFSRVQIPLGISRHVVRVPEVPGLGPLLADTPEHAKRLAIQDPDVPVGRVLQTRLKPGPIGPGLRIEIDPLPATGSPERLALLPHPHRATTWSS